MPSSRASLLDHTLGIAGVSSSRSDQQVHVLLRIAAELVAGLAVAICGLLASADAGSLLYLWFSGFWQSF